MTSTLIKNGTVVSSAGEHKADVLKVDGVIQQIGDLTNCQLPTANCQTIDASGYYLFPGLIDCHVHFREPGYEHKATMASEAVSACAGGITTVCEMPNTNPPTVTVKALQEKITIADAVTDCDIRFYFGVTEKEHIQELITAWRNTDLRRRFVGVKLYLDHSTGDQKVDGGIVEDIFITCAEHHIPLVAHCEDPDINQQAADLLYSKGNEDLINADVSYHSLMRPSASEAASIEYAISMVRKHGTAFHVAHLSTAQGADLVRAAKKEGLPVTCEVCPHHLFLSLDDYETLGTLGKMNPPLRPKEDQEALWQAITDGTVDCVATDHAPHTLEEKQSNPPLQAPSGVPGVETVLPLMLGKLEPEDIHRLMFQNPNRIFDLKKEDLTEGSSADIVMVNATQAWEFHAEDLHSKCGWTPYEGRMVQGKVVEIV